MLWRNDGALFANRAGNSDGLVTPLDGTSDCYQAGDWVMGPHPDNGNIFVINRLGSLRVSMAIYSNGAVYTASLEVRGCLALEPGGGMGPWGLRDKRARLEAGLDGFTRAAVVVLVGSTSW